MLFISCSGRNLRYLEASVLVGCVIICIMHINEMMHVKCGGEELLAH